MRGFAELQARFDRTNAAENIDQIDARDIRDPIERSRIIASKEARLSELREKFASEPVGAPE